MNEYEERKLLAEASRSKEDGTLNIKGFNSMWTKLHGTIDNPTLTKDNLERKRKERIKRKAIKRHRNS